MNGLTIFYAFLIFMLGGMAGVFVMCMAFSSRPNEETAKPQNKRHIVASLDKHRAINNVTKIAAVLAKDNPKLAKDLLDTAEKLKENTYKTDHQKAKASAGTEGHQQRLSTH